jgi:HlyD family secretion protein
MWLKLVIIPIVSLIGFTSALRVVRLGAIEPIKRPPYLTPAKPPYKKWLAGAGIVEPIAEPISVSSPLNELVASVEVIEGDQVKEGDLLFSLDARELEARREVVIARSSVAKESLAEATLGLKFYNSISNRNALSADALRQRQYAVKIAEARLRKVEAELREVEVQILRRSVKSPIAGTVLKVNIRKGELALSSGNQDIYQPPIIIGDLERLQVRVDIDEYDAWRLQKNSNATMYLRGNPKLKSDLNFVRIDPLVIPKRSLVGESRERVDTRVLQIIYSFVPKNFNIYPGQLVDVYLEAN